MPKIKYNNVLDLSVLFNSKKDLGRFANALAEHLLREFEKEKKRDDESKEFLLLPFVAKGSFGYNMDVNLFAEFMGYYTQNQQVKEDLTPMKNDVYYKRRALTFFYNGLLSQFLGVLYYGDGKSSYSLKAYFNPLIYDFGVPIRYNAICISKRFLEQNIGKEIMERFDKAGKSESVEMVAFGKSQVDDFIKKYNNDMFKVGSFSSSHNY